MVDDKFLQAVNDMSYLKWLPYLSVSPTHPLDVERDKKMAPVKEIYDYFQETSPERPFEAFLSHVTKLPAYTFKPKVDQVLDSVRLMKLANKVNRELKLMGIE